MLDKVKQFIAHAKGKLTTYVAIAIAGLARLAAHAEDILNSMPQLKAFLPAGPVISGLLMKWVIPGLGLFAVYSRVRRLLGAPPTPPG